MARQIVVEIIGDSTKFTKATDAATKSAGGFSAKTAAIMGAVSGVVQSATTRIIDSVLDYGGELLALGPKLEAMDAKAKTVFGDSLGMVQEWAAGNANAMGLTARAAVGLATNMGDLLVPMGFTRDEAAGMSEQVIGLSGALSEWSGGTRTAAEVADILQKGMLGERDALKSLGISITEADVAAQLAADGNDKLTGSALAQAKAQATLTLYMAKTKDAQDAYAAGTAKGIRSQHELQASFDEVTESLASGVAPILEAVTGWLADNLPGAIRSAQRGFQVIQPYIMAVADAVGSVIGVLMQVANVVIPVVGNVLGAFVTLWRTEFEVVSNVVGAVIGVIKNVINTVIRGWNSLRFTVPSVDLGPLGKVGGFSIGTPNIRYLHSGGVVPGTPGSDVPAILQAGETVLPAGKGGTTTVNIYGPVYGDDIDDLTRRIASRLQFAG